MSFAESLIDAQTALLAQGTTTREVRLTRAQYDMLLAEIPRESLVHSADPQYPDGYVFGMGIKVYE